MLLIKYLIRSHVRNYQAILRSFRLTPTIIKRECLFDGKCPCRRLCNSPSTSTSNLITQKIALLSVRRGANRFKWYAFISRDILKMFLETWILISCTPRVISVQFQFKTNPKWLFLLLILLKFTLRSLAP